MTPVPTGLCTEKKRSITGKINSFDCELIVLKESFGILRYIIKRDAAVSSILLAPGMETHAVYWTHRPYNVYRWIRPEGGILGTYINIGDCFRLSPGLFTWRDLVVDILIFPNGKVEVLDEHEIPVEIDPDVMCYIKSATSMVLADSQNILSEVDLLLEKYM